MQLKGNNVRKSKNVVFRNTIKGVDKDYRLNESGIGNVAFVDIADCLCYLKDGHIYCDTESTPPIPVVYGATYYGYTPWKKRTSKHGEYIKTREDTLFLKEWMECRQYFVHNGEVYVATLKQPIDEKIIKEDAEYLMKYKNYIKEKYPNKKFYLNLYSVNEEENKEVYIKSFLYYDVDSIKEISKEILELGKENKWYKIYISDYSEMCKCDYDAIIELNKDKVKLALGTYSSSLCESLLTDITYKDIASTIIEETKRVKKVKNI